jgi:hypothetical protein
MAKNVATKTMNRDPEDSGCCSDAGQRERVAHHHSQREDEARRNATQRNATQRNATQRIQIIRRPDDRAPQFAQEATVPLNEVLQ